MAHAELDRRNRDFRPDVQGLRAVAIVLVVLYHTHAGAPGGYVGVDVFFVISGFLITRQLVTELKVSGQISLPRFYARRVRRILPAATLTTVVTVIAAAVLLSPLAARQVFSDARAAAVFGANVHFAAQSADYFNDSLPPSPIQHFWSLSVEEQFYLVWPLLLMAASLAWWGLRRRASRAPPRHATPHARIGLVALVLGAVASASFAASVMLTSTSPTSAYYSILTRTWELATGALLALSLTHTRQLGREVAAALTWLGMACITVAAAAFSDATPYPGRAALLPVAGAAAIIAGGEAAARGWGAEALLGSAPFQRVGAWSYSWYLWHWPVLILAPAVLGGALSESEALAMAAVSLVIAVVSFVLVEAPVRRMSLIVRRPGLGLAAGIGLVGLSLGVTACAPALAPMHSSGIVAAPLAAHGHRLTPSLLAAKLAQGVRTRTVPANLNPPLLKAADAKPLIVLNNCSLQDAGVRSKPCVYGDRTSHVAVILYGDSHATMWFPALDAISRQQHWRLVDVTKAGCPPAAVDVQRKGAWYANCVAWRRNSQRMIAAIHPAMVIVTFARYDQIDRPLPGTPTGYGGVWENGVAAAFGFLRRSAAHVIFISDVPKLRQSAPDCLSGHPTDVPACTVSRQDGVYDPRAKAAELALGKRFGIATIDPTSWFCTPTRCPVIVGNILLYRDDTHMVPAWSLVLAPLLADDLVAAMRTPPAPAAPGGAQTGR